MEIIEIQKKLIESIDSFGPGELPHSIMLVGERGAGHEVICDYIAHKFGMFTHDITKNINKEYIDYITANPNPAIYVVNMSEISIKDQNVMLKMFEEPSKLVYIILCCEDLSQVLDTIITRSYTLNMAEYPEEELEKLIKDKDNSEIILNICTTPGQIEIANNTDIPSLHKLCKTMLKSMSKARFDNALSISDKINFGKDTTKYDLYLFFKMLCMTTLESYGEVNNMLSIYEEIIDTSKFIWTMNDKKRYFEHFISMLWLSSRG